MALAREGVRYASPDVAHAGSPRISQIVVTARSQSTSARQPHVHQLHGPHSCHDRLGDPIDDTIVQALRYCNQERTGLTLPAPGNHPWCPIYGPTSRDPPPPGVARCQHRTGGPLATLRGRGPDGAIGIQRNLGASARMGRDERIDRTRLKPPVSPSLRRPAHRWRSGPR